MLKLNEDQRRLHERALAICRRYQKIELELVSILQEIDQAKLFKWLGYSSLFIYAVEALGLSESTAYSFISVSRKAKQVPALHCALMEHKISVAKASRIVSAIDIKNADTLIGFAQTHSTRETDREVARLQPKAAKPDRLKNLSDEWIRLEVTVSHETYRKLQRALELMAAPEKDNYARVIDAALDAFLDRRDPVRKAKRAEARKANAKNTKERRRNAGATSEKLCAHRVFKRTPLSAEQRHAVFARDGGCCTHVDSFGRRCNSQRWINIHHIVPVSQGGTNDPGNLTTLCSFHHDLVHQLSLPLDGQVTWLRSRSVGYGLT